MAEQKNTQEQDLNQILKVRREKLTALQEEGRNPFEVMTYDAEVHTSDIKENFEEFEEKEVRLAGV